MDRSLDRGLARLGLLDDAAPLFAPATRVPGAGALLAIQALVESVVFEIAAEVDGHVRAYHGKRRLPKAHLARMRRAMPATSDYWVNDAEGGEGVVAGPSRAGDRGEGVTPKVVFLEVLTREQGWHHRTKGAALRERLLAELKIDVKRIEQAAAATRKATTS